MASEFPFRRALIEITNACNLSCAFCAASSRPRGFMPLSLFKSAAAQVRGLAGMVSLHVLGEPFMHPELPSILAAATREGLKVNLVTNGTLLDRFGPALFGEACLKQVTFSLHALEGLGEAGREEKLARLEEFARTRPAGLIAGFRLRGDKASPFFYWASKHLRRAFPGARETGPDAVRLDGGVFLNTGPLFDWRGGAGPGREGCMGLRHHFAVLYGGEVVPCCADYDGALALGNIKDRPLVALLDGPAAAALRQALAGRRPLPPYCSGCGFLAPG